MKTLLAASCTALLLAMASPAFACSKAGSYHRVQQAKVVTPPAPAVSSPATPASAPAPIETVSPAVDEATSTVSEALASSAS